MNIGYYIPRNIGQVWFDDHPPFTNAETES